MDEIADRLKTIVYRHGPEAISGTDGAIVPYGSTLRFLNTLGSPNLDQARAYIRLSANGSRSRMNLGRPEKHGPISGSPASLHHPSA
jgi:hypothetical protein